MRKRNGEKDTNEERPDRVMAAIEELTHGPIPSLFSLPPLRLVDRQERGNEWMREKGTGWGVNCRWEASLVSGLASHQFTFSLPYLFVSSFHLHSSLSSLVNWMEVNERGKN